MKNIGLLWLWFADLSIVRKTAAIVLVIFVVYAICELVAWSNQQITSIRSSYRRRYPHFENLKKDIHAFSEHMATVFPILCIIFPVLVWLLNKIWYMKIENTGGYPGTDPAFGILVEKGFLVMFTYAGLGWTMVGWLVIVNNFYKDSIYHRKTKSYWGLYLVPFLIVIKIIKKRERSKKK